MTTRVNGELRQETSTSPRKLGDAAALAHVTSLMTLEPGDLVVTGTPSSPLDSTIEPGDTTTVEIENIGSLSNTVEEM
jgi:2-keto-4-pentenoate hydratase/2-oxohepta-3-ene-1,7-dioic acid hydratase in catechol pathway